jgi:hypothetical protein
VNALIQLAEEKLILTLTVLALLGIGAFVLAFGRRSR